MKLTVGHSSCIRQPIWTVVTVHSIAANSNASRHLESSATMGEMHSGQNVHPPCQSAEWLTWEWTVTRKDHRRDERNGNHFFCVFFIYQESTLIYKNIVIIHRQSLETITYLTIIFYLYKKYVNWLTNEVQSAILYSWVSTRAKWVLIKPLLIGHTNMSSIE